MSPPGKTRVGIAVAALCVVWGTTWSVIQIGLRGIPPFHGVALRFAIASVLLLALVYARGIRLGRSARERWLWVVNGALSFCISYGVVYWSEQWVPSGLAAVLFATYPLFVAIIAHFALPSEPLTWRETLGALVGFAGVGVIFTEDFGALGGRQVTIAAAVMLVSPLVSAVASVAVKRWGKDVHPFSLSAVPMAMAAVVMGGLAAATERGRPLDWNPVSIGALLYLAILGSAFTFSLYYWLLSHLPAKRLALITYLIPLVAVFIGTLRGERLTAEILAGTALVLGGVAMAVHRARS